MNVPDIGTFVEVEVIDSAYSRKHVYEKPWLISPTFKCKGKVLPSPSWQKNGGFLNISADFGTQGIRQISLDKIVSIIIVTNLNSVQHKPIVQHHKSWTVKSSNGNEYTITEFAGKRKCTCTGFSFRKKCKHILVENVST